MSAPKTALARVFVGAVAGLLTLAVGTTAGAHTELDSTEPADGETVAGPVDEVVVSFSDPVTLAGDAFRVLDPQQRELSPPSVSDDGAVYRLMFDPPLAGGPVGVVYEVVAADGHVISGGFSFTVEAAPATTEADVPDEEPPPSAPSPTSSAADPPTSATAPTTIPTGIPTTVTPTTAIPTTAVTAAAAASTATASTVIGADDDGGGPSALVIGAIAISLVVVAAGAVTVAARSRATRSA